MDRSVVTRLLKGQANLTLRTIGELAWALGFEPILSLRRKPVAEERANIFTASAGVSSPIQLSGDVQSGSTTTASILKRVALEDAA